MEKVKKVVEKGKKTLSKIDKKKAAAALKQIEDSALLERIEQVAKLAGSPSKHSKILHTVWFILIVSLGAIFETSTPSTPVVVQEPTVVVGTDTLTVSQAVLQLEEIINTLKETK
jgi:hypothetical protein